MKAGQAMWSGAQKHMGANAGPAGLEAIVVELKGAAAPKAALPASRPNITRTVLLENPRADVFRLSAEAAVQGSAGHDPRLRPGVDRAGPDRRSRWRWAARRPPHGRGDSEARRARRRLSSDAAGAPGAESAASPRTWSSSPSMAAWRRRGRVASRACAVPHRRRCRRIGAPMPRSLRPSAPHRPPRVSAVAVAWPSPQRSGSGAQPASRSRRHRSASRRRRARSPPPTSIPCPAPARRAGWRRGAPRWSPATASSRPAIRSRAKPASRSCGGAATRSTPPSRPARCSTSRRRTTPASAAICSRSSTSPRTGSCTP